MVTENNSEWSKEYEDLIKKIKEKREETRRKREERDNTFVFPIAQKMSAQTIGMDLVSVQPLSAPKYGNYWTNIFKK